MPVDPFTDAELEAGTRVLADPAPCDHQEPNNPAPGTLSCDRCDVAAVLSAVAPLIAARVHAEAVDCLAELVALKDGPRNADYERRKPLAWDRARAIARAHRTTPPTDRTEEEHRG